MNTINRRCFIKATAAGAAFAAVLLVFTTQIAFGWKFLVYGDSRGDGITSQVNTNILNEIAHATTNEAPAFVLVPGDFVWAGSEAAFVEWKGAMAPVYDAGIHVYPIMGNHEISNPEAFINAFGAAIPDNGPPGEINRTYAITHENVLIVMLDNYVNMHRVNQPWINSIFATNVLPHVFAVGHEPAFKVLHYDMLDDYPQERDAFWRSLGFGGATAYFCGHDHFYDHTRLDDGDGNPDNDIHQYVVATAGAPLYGDGPYDGDNGPWTPTRIFHENQYGYVVVEINGMDVTITFKHRTAPGMYEATSDIHTRTVQMQRPVLALKKEGTNVRLRAQRLTSNTSNTVQRVNKLGGTWLPIHSFTAISNSYEKVFSSSAEQQFFRLQSW